MKSSTLRLTGVFAACLLLAFAGRARAYVDISPTLGFIIKDSSAIVVLQVDKVSHEKRGIVFKKIADLKEATNGEPVRHHLDRGSHPREPRIVLDWATPGQTAIAFIHDKSAVVCIGEYWYECAYRADNWWIMTSGRPELSLAFFGTAEKLRDAVTEILKGKEVVVTAVNHGAKFGVFQYENVAFHKALRGKDCPLFRIKASLEMPDTVWRVSAKDSPWVVGVGAYGTEDIPALTANLKSENAKTRAKAADDLGLIGWRARGATPMLFKLCEDADPYVRISAARAIDLVGGDFTYPVKVLGDILKNESSGARRAAATALGDLEADARGAVVPLQEALRDSDAGVRWQAAEALGRIGPDAAPAVSALADALRDPQVRVMAADALAGIGKAARGAVPLLVDGVKDTDPDFRWTCSVALTQVDAKSARAALPLFIEKLQDADHRVRWDAMAYVVPMGTEARDAAPPVRAMVKRGNGVAAACLAAICGPDAREDALPVLLHVLADDWDTTPSIAQIGPTALPDLLRLIDNPEAKNHHLAIKAVGLLAPQTDKAVPALIECLRNRDPITRRAAAATLGAIEPRTKEIASGLRESLKDKEAAVRLAASNALRLYDGAEAGFAVSTLMELLTHADAEVRRDAATALAGFGQYAKAALPPLHKLQNDPDPIVRNAASWAEARIVSSTANRLAVVSLIAALKDRDPKTRQDACRLLGLLGHDARDAITALGDARQDDVEYVRVAAAEALLKIR